MLETVGFEALPQAVSLLPPATTWVILPKVYPEAREPPRELNIVGEKEEVTSVVEAISQDIYIYIYIYMHNPRAVAWTYIVYGRKSNKNNSEELLLGYLLWLVQAFPITCP